MNKEIHSGQGLYSTLEGFDGLMGARNIRASLSPLHSEVEAFIWAMKMYEEFTSVSCHICNRLFLIGEYGFETRRMINICKIHEDIKILRRSFYN